jgi:hypothetical protein
MQRLVAPKLHEEMQRIWKLKNISQMNGHVLNESIKVTSPVPGKTKVP